MIHLYGAGCLVQQSHHLITCPSCAVQDSQRQKAETALQELRREAQSNLDHANALKAQLQSELITAQQKMASLQKERTEVTLSTHVLLGCC